MLCGVAGQLIPVNAGFYLPEPTGLSTRAMLRDLFTRPFRLGAAEELCGIVIAEPLDLSGVMLPNLDLTGAVFKVPASFRGATFQGLAWLRNVTFEAPADFSEASFAGDARFDGARFQAAARFSSTRFDGVPCFDGAQFAAAAFMDRMICSGSLSLARARFHGPVCLRNTACYGGLWCEGAQFFSSVDTRGLEIHGRNLTAGTKLEQKVPPASV